MNNQNIMTTGVIAKLYDLVFNSLDGSKRHKVQIISDTSFIIDEDKYLSKLELTTSGTEGYLPNPLINLNLKGLPPRVSDGTTTGGEIPFVLGVILSSVSNNDKAIMQRIIANLQRTLAIKLVFLDTADSQITTDKITSAKELSLFLRKVNTVITNNHHMVHLCNAALIPSLVIPSYNQSTSGTINDYYTLYKHKIRLFLDDKYLTEASDKILKARELNRKYLVDYFHPLRLHHSWSALILDKSAINEALVISDSTCRHLYCTNDKVAIIPAQIKNKVLTIDIHQLAIDDEVLIDDFSDLL